MEIEKNVDYGIFPNQGEYLGKAVEVCFDYDTSRTLKGIVVRDDIEHPFKTIIKLETRKYILSTECQFTLGVS